MTGSSDQSLEELRILLLRYIEGSLDLAAEQAVNDILRTDEQARKELEGLKTIMDALETDQTLFCPDPSEISDFVITGNDPLGTITGHLKECRSCLEEVQSLGRRQPSDGIPPRIWETIRDKLAEVGPETRHSEFPFAADIKPSYETTPVAPPVLEKRSYRPMLMPAPAPDERPPSRFWKVLIAIGTAVGVALLLYYFIRGTP